MPVEVDEGLVVVERAGAALVVRARDAGAAGVGFAAGLAAEPFRTTVVVDRSAAEALAAADDHLVGELRRAATADQDERGGVGWGIRLVGPRTASVAARLAGRLGIEVVAPDGELVVLRGGELFSAGPGAGWLAFRGDRDPQWHGPRYPAPGWQASLPRDHQGRAVVETPAGLWLREGPVAPPADLGFGVPAEPHRPLVLAGAPGETPPDPAALAEVYASLPAGLREKAVLVPYGLAPRSCGALAQGLADRLDLPVRAYHALPYYTADGTRSFAVYDESGAPVRPASLPERTYVPSRPAVFTRTRSTPHKDRCPFHGPTSHGDHSDHRDHGGPEPDDELDPAAYVIVDTTPYR